MTTEKRVYRFTKTLGRQFLAPLRAAAGDDLAAGFSRHARAKAVAPLADQFARLVGAFHVRLQFLKNRAFIGCCIRQVKFGGLPAAKVLG